MKTYAVVNIYRVETGTGARKPFEIKVKLIDDNVRAKDKAAAIKKVRDEHPKLRGYYIAVNVLEILHKDKFF